MYWKHENAAPALPEGCRLPAEGGPATDQVSERESEWVSCPGRGGTGAETQPGRAGWRAAAERRGAGVRLGVCVCECVSMQEREGGSRKAGTHYANVEGISQKAI